jgi:dTDP-4-dehydrorhamnose 3,5-epimerase
MIFEATEIPGAFLIHPRRVDDERGFFARTFCIQELAEHGLDARVVQRSLSFSQHRGTLRGMHFQAAPHGENKFVTCSRGAIYDVIIDLRPSSTAYRKWLAFTLTEDNLDTLFIPEGCAHGFLTLRDETVVRYDISAFYAAAAARGVRFDDPAFNISWPATPAVISSRDLAFPRFDDPLPR